MSTISNANVRATKATGARAKEESGKTTDSSDGVVREPSRSTQIALDEIAAGDVKTAYSIEELMADLEADD